MRIRKGSPSIDTPSLYQKMRYICDVNTQPCAVQNLANCTWQPCLNLPANQVKHTFLSDRARDASTHDAFLPQFSFLPHFRFQHQTTDFALCFGCARSKVTARSGLRLMVSLFLPLLLKGTGKGRIYWNTSTWAYIIPPQGRSGSRSITATPILADNAGLVYMAPSKMISDRITQRQYFQSLAVIRPESHFTVCSWCYRRYRLVSR